MVYVKSSESQAALALLPIMAVNAARGLLWYLAGSGPESLNARGGIVRPGPARHVPVKREPGAGKPGQTGTAAWQRAAAA